MYKENIQWNIRWNNLKKKTVCDVKNVNGVNKFDYSRKSYRLTIVEIKIRICIGIVENRRSIEK